MWLEQEQRPQVAHDRVNKIELDSQEMDSCARQFASENFETSSIRVIVSADCWFVVIPTEISETSPLGVI